MRALLTIATARARRLSPMARAISGGFFPSSPMARAQNAELSPTQNGSAAAAAVTAFNLDELDSLERSRRGYPTLSDYGWRRCAGGTTPPELGNPARPTFLQSIGKTGSNTSLAMQSAVKERPTRHSPSSRRRQARYTVAAAVRQRTLSLWRTRRPTPPSLIAHACTICSTSCVTTMI